MKLNIELIEDLICRFKQSDEKEEYEQAIAVENLLKTYKMEQKLRKIEEDRLRISDKDLTTNYIPISKILNELKLLDEEEKEAQNSISDEEREEHSDASISWLLMDIEIRRRCYKKLLKEDQ